ncbi:MAG: selenide, water dikinase SelD, partial [Candidatus Competibacterales bacterium]
VGGGAGGVEGLLAMRHALHTRLELPCGSRGEGFHWRLVTATADILPGHHRRVRDRYRRLLAHRGVAVELNQRVAAVEPRAVVTAAGQRFDADVVVWVTGAQPAPWLADTGLALDERGFIEVDATLESRSHAGVFAAGDVASVVEYPRPKAGVFAVRQGPPLTANLRRALRGQRRRPFAPQRQFLSLISTGDRFAVASRGPVVLAGSWVWRWKDAIDRGFMARYQQLPAMASETPGEETTMRCGGCGAKVDGGLLQNALKACTSHPRGDVVQGFENPDDAAVLRPTPAGTLELYSVDGFRAPLDDPYRVGRIVTHHALSDIYAMGGEPRGALVLAQLPFGPEVQQARTLAMLMAGINGVLTGEGVSLLGGHTGEGPELYVGLAVTGCVEPAALRLKGGLVPGQQLLLTKPLGTGVLLAGHMRGLTKGPWMAAALASMDRSNGNAARALLAAGATAMTDVTGFGVLGHLLEMCRAGGVGARLFIHGLPALPGALSLLERGVASTFALQNQNFMTELQLDDIAPGDPGLALLFDPQTSGGLLAGVPADAVAACRRALAAVGCDCWSIGEVLPAPGAQVPVQLTKAAPLASVLPQAPLTA